MLYQGFRGTGAIGRGFCDVIGQGRTVFTQACRIAVRVAAAQQEDHTLIAVVLGAKKETTSDGKTVSGAFTQASTLMDWGFFNYDTALFYQEYLDALPSPSPEPDIPPEETASQDSMMDPEEAPAEAESTLEVPEASEALPLATVQPSEALADTTAPTPTVSASAPASQRNAAAMISAIAASLGLSPFALLIIIFVAAVVMLIIVVVVLVLLLKRR